MLPRAVVISVLLVLAPARARAGDRATMAEREPTERHVRLRTPRGALHLWHPANYDAATAATVVYVHGYFANVDDAWRSYRLRDQFRASGLNALFIACEAPTGERGRVSWPSLEALLATAGHALPLPAGRVVAMGHSGAHRTIAMWLDAPALDTVVLMDAAYGDLAAYALWLDERPGRRLLDVGDLTRRATDAFHDDLPESVVVDRFPPPTRGALPAAALDARIVYVRSSMGHMQLVRRGIAIPMLLRALLAPVVPGGDRAAPLTPL